MDAVGIVERDEAGRITASFSRGRWHPREPRSSVLQRLVNVFLPAGFPGSVSEDYVGYQIYDSLQAFSSSIAGLLASRAVLQGFGVGDANASATAALLLTILQALENTDSVGRLATILFAHRFGTALEPECKKYRFAADIFNDAAMVLDCLSPVFPPAVRVPTLCTSGALRALCGVAGGGSKASLSVHFARAGNVGELNAKKSQDSSQETVISLLGMLTGSVVVSHITSTWATWTTLALLLTAHLTTNYLAVRCVALRTLNRQRANIVFSTLASCGRVLSPGEAAAHERVLERDGVLRAYHYCHYPASSPPPAHPRSGNVHAPAPLVARRVGTAVIGGGFAALLRVLCVGAADNADERKRRVSALVRAFEEEKYLLWFCGAPGDTRVVVCVKEGAAPADLLKGWVHALTVASSEAGVRSASGPTSGPALQKKQEKARSQLAAQAAEKPSDRNAGQKKEKGENDTTGQEQGEEEEAEEESSWLRRRLHTLKLTRPAQAEFLRTLTRLEEVGWDVAAAALETAPGTRLGCFFLREGEGDGAGGGGGGEQEGEGDCGGEIAVRDIIGLDSNRRGPGDGVRLRRVA